MILTGLKFECILLPCLGDPEGQDPIAKEDGDGTVPNPDGVISEGEASLAEDD